MKTIISAEQSNCNYPPQDTLSPFAFGSSLTSEVTNFYDDTFKTSGETDAKQCNTWVSVEYDRTASNSTVATLSQRLTNATATNYFTDRNESAFNQKISARALTSKEKGQSTISNTYYSSYSSSGSNSYSASGSTSQSGSTNSRTTPPTRASSSSSSSSSISNSSSDSGSTDILNTNSNLEEGYYTTAFAKSETTDEDASDTIYYKESRSPIIRTSSVCSTDQTATAPTSFEDSYYTTENFTKFLVSTTEAEFPIVTETTVDYFKTYTIATDWTQTVSTEWTSTETSETSSFESTEQNTTTNSRNDLGELIEYETTERVNTTKATVTTVSTTTSKETTETGGTTETTTATRSRTDGTDTTLTEDEISTWVEGTSTKFKKETSQRDIETSDLDFCDYGGWVEGCITFSQNDYIAEVIEPPESGKSPFYTQKQITITDTGETLGSYYVNSSTEHHFDKGECLVEFQEPNILAGQTKWCFWDELFTSSSVDQVESTTYAPQPLKKSSKQAEYYSLPDYGEIEYRTGVVSTLNPVDDVPYSDYNVTLETYDTVYNSAPQLKTSRFNYFLQVKSFTYLSYVPPTTAGGTGTGATPNTVETTLTTTVDSTYSSKILLPVKGSTSHLGTTYSHLFGWDLVDQTWFDTTVATYKASSHSFKEYAEIKFWDNGLSVNSYTFISYNEEGEPVGTGTISDATTFRSQKATAEYHYTDAGRGIINRLNYERAPLSNDEANFFTKIQEEYDKLITYTVDGEANYPAKMTAVYEPDIKIGYIGFGEVLQENLATAEAYGVIIKKSSGETFNSDDELNIDLTNVSSAALLAVDSASIFYTSPCFAPDFGEQAGTTSWGATRKCSDEDEIVEFNTSTEVHATYTKEYEEDGSTLTSSAYATYSLSLILPLENYPNPVLLKASVADDIAGDRQKDKIYFKKSFGLAKQVNNPMRINNMFQIKNVTDAVSYTLKKGEYDIKIYNKSNEVVQEQTRLTTIDDIEAVIPEGQADISVRKFTSNDIFLYHARNYTNNYGPLPHTFYSLNEDLYYRFFQAYKFSNSNHRTNYSNSGREEGWLGPTVSLCDSTG